MNTLQTEEGDINANNTVHTYQVKKKKKSFSFSMTQWICDKRKVMYYYSGCQYDSDLVIKWTCEYKSDI